MMLLHTVSPAMASDIREGKPTVETLERRVTVCLFRDSVIVIHDGMRIVGRARCRWLRNNPDGTQDFEFVEGEPVAPIRYWLRGCLLPISLDPDIEAAVMGRAPADKPAEGAVQR